MHRFALKGTLKDFVAVLARPVLSKIHRYKDAHRGESCYLFGDGISVKWFDLAAFDNRIGIPCGYFPFHKDFKKLQVPYAILAEPWWFYPTVRSAGPPKRIIRNPIQSAYRSVIDENPEKRFFVNLSNYPVLRQKNIVYTFRDLCDNRLPPNFITNRINAFHGSLRTSILLAAYLGFDRCFLVGYDYTHVPSRTLHWYEKGEGIFNPLDNYSKDFFEIARDFIDITTITLDGTSEFIDAVTYSEFTGRVPFFRENTELLSDSYIKVLSSWPGYSV